jgi:anti-sigma factor RsiW
VSTTCKHCIDLLVDYLDGALPPDQQSTLDGHLHGCGACEEFLATYRATTSLCKKALAKEMPESLANKLHTFIQQTVAAEAKKG